MGLNDRDKTDINATKESRQAVASETGNPTAKESSNATKRSPDLRRRALIAGLATTPVLLSLSNRSAFGQNVDCSLLSSIILGGSVANLPPAVLNGQGWDHNNVPEHALENMYEAQNCNGNNASSVDTNGSSNRNPTGNPSGNSNP